MHRQYPLPTYTPYPPSLPLLPARRRQHGDPHQNQAAAHTLPPAPSEDHAPNGYRSETYPARSQPLQASLMTAPQEQASHSVSYPLYPQPANVYYNDQSAFSLPSPTPPMQQQSRPSSVNGLPQPIYTSAPTVGRLPDLLPMPPRPNGRHSLPIRNRTNELDTVEEPQPTHVVGSQGRRGILPSAPGRSTAMLGANACGQKGAPTPPKDANGKYPCPHCTKTYLHAKHLKRHMLRHTGVRPYTCGLCKDTFSRSDILKRHFQKCSVRRGNPSGESHLSHSRANKKMKQEDEARAANNTPTNTPTQMNQAQQVEVFTPTHSDADIDFNTLNINNQNQPLVYMENANQNSRSNSFRESQRSSDSHSNRTSLTLVNTSLNDVNYGYASGHVTPDSATTSGVQTPYTSYYDSRSNPISPAGAYNAVNGRDMLLHGGSRAPTSSNFSLPHIAGQRGGHDLDYPSFFSNINSNDDYAATQYHSGTNTPLHAVKPDPEVYGYMPTKA